MDETDLRKKIKEIMEDANLTDAQKSEARQQLLTGKPPSEKPHLISHTGNPTELSVKCTICLSLCERPVTAPCSHNFCLTCLSRYLSKGNKRCPLCRHVYTKKFASNPRVNTLLAAAIRLARSEGNGEKKKDSKPFVRMDNESRPERAFVTERARRNGMANAASGRIMVTVPNDWFGPILPEHDPETKRGVCVGDWWADRMDCRQYGAHFPHVAGIAGQSSRGKLYSQDYLLRCCVLRAGAQSVVLSGGYEDDVDRGDWFLYTGSGGRDLSGNRRTNKNQSFDQEFKSFNEALRVSCIKGLPIRVVRSHKEKRSNYAPPSDMPVRYDGIYRILRCWRKPGKQNYLMCRYLFVRCDNSPAPWSTKGETLSFFGWIYDNNTDYGDSPSLEVPEDADREIKQASGRVYEMGDDPYWDFDKKSKAWRFFKEQPPHAAPRDPRPKKVSVSDLSQAICLQGSNKGSLLKKFKCRICSEIMKAPVTTPCQHSFCQVCLQDKFKSMADIIDRHYMTGHSLRVKKVVKPCPVCQADIADFLKTASINRELEGLIKRLSASVGGSNSETQAESEEESQSSSLDSVPIKESTPEIHSEVNTKLEALCLDYPDFERDVIEGLLFDQGNDAEEVMTYLEKMRRSSRKEEAKSKRDRSSETTKRGGAAEASKKRKKD